MTSIIKKRGKKYGLSPGSLVLTEEPKDTKVKVQLIEFDADMLKIKDNASLDECVFSKEHPPVTWINITGIHDIQLVAKIGTHLKLHPLVLEDILSNVQRSKVDNYKDTLYIVMRQLDFNSESEQLKDSQISLILGKDFVISFLEAETDLFAPVVNRLKVKNSRLRTRGADYLCYALIDCIIDYYFITLANFDEVLDRVEEKLLDRPNPKTIKKILAVKRQILTLRRAIWPTREIISQLQRLESNLISKTTRFYLQDVYDHSIQAIETIESFRDISSSLIEVYVSSLSYKMNEIMKVLTIMATIFVPLTFIASIYGMNFNNIPELQWKYGYFYALFLMLAVGFGMLYYFRRKKWI